MDNQTERRWVEATSDDDEGTGIFLKQGSPTPIKSFEQDMTYAECVARGQSAIAFKWVPHDIASFSALQAAGCGNRRCVDFCVKPGCICDRASGRCV